MLTHRDNGRKAELHLLNTFKRKATLVIFCVTDTSYFFSLCFCTPSKTLSVQLHNSGNFLQVIILSTWLKAKIACNLLVLKSMCFSGQNVRVNHIRNMTYSTTTEGFFFFFFFNLYRKLYLYPWFPPKSTPPSFYPVHKQYFPFFLLLKEVSDFCLQGLTPRHLNPNRLPSLLTLP